MGAPIRIYFYYQPKVSWILPLDLRDREKDLSLFFSAIFFNRISCAKKLKYKNSAPKNRAVYESERSEKVRVSEHLKWGTENHKVGQSQSEINFKSTKLQTICAA